MNLAIILCTLAAAQSITSEIPSVKSTLIATTATAEAVKSTIIPKKPETQPATVVAAAKAKSTATPAPTVEIKTYDDTVLKNNISELNKRQSQQDIFLRQLLQDIAFIKRSLVKIVNQNTDWTIIQRRQDGSENFYRTWEEYKEGFGNPQGEFFIGLDSLHEMTSDGDEQELLIILEDFENNTRFAKYDLFKVGSEDDKYAIEELGEYSGNAGDSMTYHKGRKFSTKDQDNDNHPTENCAVVYEGGWWFDKCYSSHLNGPYYKGARSCRGGINWYHWHNYMYSLKFVEMMIRPAPSKEE